MSKVNSHPKIIVLVSANAEWCCVREIFQNPQINISAFGEWFLTQLSFSSCLPLDGDRKESSSHPGDVIFFNGGWGKVAAAASTQYVINHWQPDLLINLGTCGGIKGLSQKGEILLVEKTLIYDINEKMGDFDAAIEYYSVHHDLSWISEPYPIPVRRSILVSADRDLAPEEIPELTKKYKAIAADWESGAIAWVSRKNNIPVLILRGVTDLVDKNGSEAYGNIHYFESSLKNILQTLVKSLPEWIKLYQTVFAGN